eukprot:c11801_g1_i2.p1 GENE.c11801_g1_i2~~c11801_g1_i2.p1  ORF type:complete len:202 (-),score=53.81 c11801_g1_i2:975-1550(-)
MGGRRARASRSSRGAPRKNSRTFSITETLPIQQEPNADEAIKAMFNEIAGDDQHIDFSEWTELCVNQLHMNLEHTELRRVFDQVDKDGSNTIDYTEFSSGMDSFGFLKSVAQAIAVTKGMKFKVPDTFDFEKSTNDNYKADASVGFAPTYADIRETRDYSYHTHYTMERQKWQDSVISSVASQHTIHTTTP